MAKVVMALSGGMDSTTLLAFLLSKGHQVECLNFTYGSKHNQYECISAENVAIHYNVPYKLIDLSKAFEGFKSNLLKTGDEIPEGHYEQDNMSLTVVPGRNTIFASIMYGYAESIRADYISLGVHAGDHAIYADCRIEYIKALDTLIYLASNKTVQVIAPFLEINKYGILQLGYPLNVQYEITRTCYKDQILSCGKCGSCTERLEAFQLLGIEDPIQYAYKEIV